MNPYEQTVTLIDGRQVSSFSEEWRAECEARAVCRMPTRQHRNRYMEKVQAKRGKPAHDALWHLVTQVWNAEFRAR